MITFRRATIQDLMLYYNWVNDSVVRYQSFNSSVIDLPTHTEWFKRLITDPFCIPLIFQNDQNQYIGQIRMQKGEQQDALIGISVAEEHRGNGYAKKMLISACEYFFKENPEFQINAFIKELNTSSIHSFEKAGFKFLKKLEYQGTSSVQYVKIKDENR